MSDILQKILATKREEIAVAKQRTSLAAIEAQARAQTPPRDFIGVIKTKIAHGHAAVIAEIKKSQSKQRCYTC